jgi:hypothetical protein
MVTKEEVEHLMLKYFPTCPLCGANKGYEVSGLAKTYAQCRSCGAKWMSADFAKCKEIKEMYLSEPTYDGKGASLRMPKKYPVKFWQDSNAIENAIKAEESALSRKSANKIEIEERESKTKLIFHPEMTDQQLKTLIKESLDEIPKWDYGSTIYGKGLGSLISNTSFAEATTIRLLRAILEQNKILIIQNELLRRALSKTT